jgi:hypothetical protein
VLLPGPGFVRPERAYQVADVSGLLLKKDAVGILSRPVMVVGAVAYPATLRCWQGSKDWSINQDSAGAGRLRARAAWSNPGGFSPGQGCGIIAVTKIPLARAGGVSLGQASDRPPDVSGSKADIRLMTKQLSPQEWLLQAVSYFRSLGFFEQYHAQSDEELFTTLMRLSGESLLHRIGFSLSQMSRPQSEAELFDFFVKMFSGGVLGKSNEALLRQHRDEILPMLKHAREEGGLDNILPSTPGDLDLILLGLDGKRVWWGDTEADVCRENGVYVRTLKKWSAISRGAFMPEDIQEFWKRDEGPIKITFTHKSRLCKLHPRHLGDFIDVGVLAEVNEIIEDTGIQFAVYDTRDQFAFVVALTDDEREKLQRERGWRFAKI